ncbi:uncharacterized protein LOC116260784 [Nymphaea colorata]|nr:uncharacterized protein LOC116260784 [Nymphaea colorata]
MSIDGPNKENIPLKDRPWSGWQHSKAMAGDGDLRRSTATSGGARRQPATDRIQFFQQIVQELCWEFSVHSNNLTVRNWKKKPHHLGFSQGAPNQPELKHAFLKFVEFLDNDSQVYLDISYTFDIRKEWPSPS